MLSTPAAAWLNTMLVEAADELRVGDGYVSELQRATTDEIRAQLQAWRDQLLSPAPVVSRELVEAAFWALGAVPDLCEAVAKYPNDSELGGIVRELVTAAPDLLRGRILLLEALAP